MLDISFDDCNIKLLDNMQFHTYSHEWKSVSSISEIIKKKSLMNSLDSCHQNWRASQKSSLRLYFSDSIAALTVRYRIKLKKIIAGKLPLAMESA